MTIRQSDDVVSLLKQIAEADDPAIFIDLLSETELREAVEAGDVGSRDRPLEGATFAVKDNIDVAGRMTTSAMPSSAYQAEASAPVVEQLIRAGAVLVGKTNLDQFATGLVGVRTPYGIPRNPLDLTRVPGGSSCGSAVAVARGLVDFALGTDTAGSGRVPAAFCGLVGLKPAVGEWSTQGVVPASRSYDCVSVFAGSIAEATRVAATLGPAWPAAEGQFTIGVPAPEFLVSLDRETATQFATDLAILRSWGSAQVVEVDMAPFFEAADLLYGSALVAERTTAVGARLAAGGDDVVDVVRQVVAMGDGYSAVEAFAALARLDALRAEATDVFAQVDVLAIPSVPTIPTLDEVAADPIDLNTRLGRFTNFVNPLHLAALAVPTGRRADGLRGSVTVLGPAGREPLLVSTGSHLTGEIVEATVSQVGDVDLAVVGAHLSGEPLNGQLTERGARLVARTTTAPTYRLHHLPGGPPERPALERVEPAHGRAIELEVWRLDQAGFGAVTAEVAPPLGIGSVELGHGRWVKGFVCESGGLAGARDITKHGGWRSYLRSPSGW